MRPGDTRHRTARIALAVSAALGVALILAPSAFAGFITPKTGGSPNADAISSLYKIVLYIAAVVFVIVEGALAYSVYRFRAKKNPVAAQIHGNTRLEIGWTVAAALILVVLTVVTFMKLPSIINAAELRLRRPRALGLDDRAESAERQEVRDLRAGPPVHLALHLRRRLPEQLPSP